VNAVRIVDTECLAETPGEIAGHLIELIDELADVGQGVEGDRAAFNLLPHNA